MIDRQFTETLSTKRASFENGKRSGPTINLLNVVCSPAYPATVDSVARLETGQDSLHPYSLYEVYVDGHPDIKRGDTIVLCGTDYTVENVGRWERRIKFMKLVVQDVESDGS